MPYDRWVTSAIISQRPLGNPPWVTVDPFLFCVHHVDNYPAGNEQMGPAASLAGRQIGMDFEGKDGWRMYHGDTIPGFPQHPHRGFETVTLVRKGRIDHSDSLGATARFGDGDVQWMTAGKGIVHSEMFPLRDQQNGNPLELFQIWLNLPRADKMVEPHFKMLWSGDIPRCQFEEPAGKHTLVTVVAGELNGERPPSPPPSSWGSKAESDLAIWTIAMDAGASFRLPVARGEGTVRTLYLFSESGLEVDGQAIAGKTVMVLDATAEVKLQAPASSSADCLLLQGRPLQEPVAQYGPFVMNNQAEIQQAMNDYQRTQFGGWPYPSHGPVHPRGRMRFAQHPDGRLEEGR